ncbi:inactive leucine-rich repeat receptor-like protein kinase-like [Dorcoceras hygrometricum]|uniref:Inactive leucine-rich repeat receptor-like protein kinase-like n=1 Tax=Dorcoceras hygrometricum TaxID=472368 RepID=A0A2Z7AUX6_9LAMI|nr:inactive leucine-rich repeat receptor-like protein kinase-like [Dorcoceras hygrometricum]
MKSFFSVLIFATFLLATFLRGCFGEETLQLNDDVLGLLVFKSALQDPWRNLDSWNEDDNSPCGWKFVKCNLKTGRVTEISLDGLGLSGKFGRGLEKLRFLKVLSLSNNKISGGVNPELALVTSLERLNLSRNNLTGEIPSFLDNMSSIQSIDVSQNSLSGPVSDTMFGNCTALRFVSLSGNFLEGQIPGSVGRCAVLNHLNLSNNRFSGNPRFSGGIWSLAKLRTLDLSNNALSGSVPVGIAVVHNMKQVFLNGNQFSGSLPDDIGLCPHVNTLDFSSNRFTERVPESLQRLSSLSYLNLSNNLLTGDFPQWISTLTSLEYIDFSRNYLMGSLPMSMGDLKSLKFLSLSENKLNGTIPESMRDYSSLTVINLSKNGFNGSIPKGLFNMNLEEMDLSRNELSGPIPSASSKIFESLQMLDLSDNSLTGEIPAEISLSSKLGYLNLSWNHLESRMPSELGYFQNLSVLDLRNNGLIGSVPGDICDSGSMAILQLDGNSLTGPIPVEIGNCTSLYLLSLSHNNLSGPIPRTMSMLNNLKILKLEFNELSGEIPQDLGKLENLLIANVSYNRLVGRLPPGGIFQTLDASAIQGNLGICSPLLKGPCKLNVPKPLVLDPFAYGSRGGDRDENNRQHPSSSTDSTNFRHHRFLSVSSLVAISAAAVIAVGVIVITLLNASARRKISYIENALESMCSSSTRSANLAAGKLVLFDSKSTPDWLSTSIELILNKATEIGEGVFGTVYKASLGREGTVVAIKKLVTANTLQYQEEFDREVRILGKARHPHLISLRGYYWTPHLQLLVSDYAAEGSLQGKLHEQTSSFVPLVWPQRFKIVLGTAKGLAYLHHSFRPSIIHYNIKPCNILLDENLNPKISDFGLARLLTKLDKHVVSNRFQSAPGYVAPELACQSLRVNEKCDVYGFGVLILELVTGRRPVEYGEDNVVILSDHVRVLLEQGNVLDCVDPGMGEYPQEEVLPVLKLALVCTSQIPSSRPSMAEVVQILQVIQTPVAHRVEAF